MELKIRLGRIIAVLLFCFGACAFAAPSAESLDFSKLLEGAPQKHIFKSDEYFIWCNGVVKGEDGKYHMFFSRWPRKYGFKAWVTHSEIAHAVSDNLLGPYEYKDTPLPARGSEYWDGLCTHNAHIMKAGGKYYIYYMGNDGGTSNKKAEGDAWWRSRNAQRVGVAVADSPYGPWTRFDKPLIAPREGEVLTSTPTVSARADGGFLMVFKAVKDNGTVKGGGVTHYAALAPTPLGQWTRFDKPFIETPKSAFPIDDHVEWFEGGKYYCIAKDHAAYDDRLVDGRYVPDARNSLTPDGRALLLFESADGLNWKLAPQPLVTRFQIKFANGEEMFFERFEMPKVYIEDGKIKALFLAAKPRGRDESFSVALPIKEH